METIREIWEYLKVKKKWWLLPILVVLFILGFVVVMSSGSAVAPFIYTLF